MEKRIDLQSLDDDVLRTRARGSVSESKGQDFDDDLYDLARVGKKQRMKVSMSTRNFHQE